MIQLITNTTTYSIICNLPKTYNKKIRKIIIVVVYYHEFFTGIICILLDTKSDHVQAHHHHLRIRHVCRQNLYCHSSDIRGFFST